ncbi:uncharacterized protein F4822DRAFT_436168 [Hypoxylon trugodes]|uniref:uncharacterized protein n=1 Tax=Hypoxylon trugodes TaxID=326681 RepID=UPI0021932B10|nr:uncharacterized protein F4822DRAFT_436168 [Hypoxylon trugodes]KAI1392206.1 hypothetical protein F4822DRAFT_436168 [Hypoxylon trugodes]
MGDLKARIKAKLLRRHSGIPSLGSSKQSLSRERASSSTHTQASTTGYAASLSTAAGDEKDSNEKGHNAKDDNSRHGSTHSSRDSPTAKNGVNRIDPSQSRSRAERVPPELEQAEQLDLVVSTSSNSSSSSGNSNPTHNNNHNHPFSGSTANLEVDADADADAGTSGSATTSAKVKVKVKAKTKVNKLIRSPTVSNCGKDLQNSAINSRPIPTITTPTSSLDPNPEPDQDQDQDQITNNPNNNFTSIPTTAAATPLPSIHEYRPANSHLQLKPPIFIDHHLRDNNSISNDDDYYDNNSSSSNYNTRPTSAGRAFPASSSLARPAAPPRRQSILSNRQTTLIKTLLNTGYASDIGSAEPDQLLPISGNMVTRKVWVKRPLASATLITINEEDLVDDVRELILRKYANSLGRQFDAPDLTLRICDREQQTTRPLQPDEPMGRTLDAYYPGGQSVDDALLIDIPSRRTPKASPNPRYYSDDRPHESGTDYFPPYPPASQHPSASSVAVANGAHSLHFPPSLTVLSGGQLPPLPSPGGTRRLGSSRPKIQRMHTASPVSTAANGHASQSAAPPTGMHNYPRQPRSRTHSGASSEQSNHPPAAPSIPTPPVPERTATPPPPRVSSPRPINRPKKSKKTTEHPSLPPGMLNGGVPPINVLIVEDNIINLKLLEAFVKRLKVRWQTAMNGREAVNKWRAGGFHLVLMDIQLPVMSGLEATREIRRIEKVNSIGVFSSSASSPPDEVKAEPEEEDKLVNTEMFKSPVIIVALTASSLQSDRHEALAAGCNDFLTKPVNFVWLERKVMEWGCMQALIDFDGWRKWKDFSQKAEEDDSKKAAAAKAGKMPKKNRLSMTAAA